MRTFYVSGLEYARALQWQAVLPPVKYKFWQRHKPEEFEWVFRTGSIGTTIIYRRINDGVEIDVTEYSNW